MNRPLFPTTLSIPSYDIGKWVGLRTYQHPSYMLSRITRRGHSYLLDTEIKLYTACIFYTSNIKHTVRPSVTGPP